MTKTIFSILNSIRAQAFFRILCDERREWFSKFLKNITFGKNLRSRAQNLKTFSVHTPNPVQVMFSSLQVRKSACASVAAHRLTCFDQLPSFSPNRWKGSYRPAAAPGPSTAWRHWRFRILSPCIFVGVALALCLNQPPVDIFTSFRTRSRVDSHVWTELNSNHHRGHGVDFLRVDQVCFQFLWSWLIALLVKHSLNVRRSGPDQMMWWTCLQSLQSSGCTWTHDGAL